MRWDSRHPCFQETHASVQDLLHLTFLLQCRKKCIRNSCSNSECYLPPDILFASLQEVIMPKAELVTRWKESCGCSKTGHSAVWARLKPHSNSVRGMLHGFARQNQSVPQGPTDAVSSVTISLTLTVRSGSCCPFTSLKMFKMPITVFYKTPKSQTLAKEPI